jgi:GNAT superfamily N-acetyltransferase
MQTTERPASSKSSSPPAIKPIGDEHREWLNAKMKEIWSGRFVVTRGVAYEPATLPGFIAYDKGNPVGVATYHINDDECELITLDALSQWHGVGTALIDAVEEEARKQACSRMWMITTNDNIDGLRFYQRRGYVMCAVHINAIDQSRKIKPTIPLVGNYGIEIRDEIELEKYLWCWIGW